MNVARVIHYENSKRVVDIHKIVRKLGRQFQIASWDIKLTIRVRNLSYWSTELRLQTVAYLHYCLKQKL